MVRFRRQRPDRTAAPVASLSDSLEDLGRRAALVAPEPLRSQKAQELREAAEGLDPAGAAGSAVLQRGAAALELGALHALAMGYLLRVAEAEALSPAPLGPELAARLRAAADPVREADAIAREVARPRPGGPSADFNALFGAGPDVWSELEGWVEAVGRAATRRRLRERLDAAGVGADFDLEPALARISQSLALRSGYVLAACERELEATARDESDAGDG